MKKILISIVIMASGLLSLPALAQDCRSGVDHKHPSCYGRFQQTQHHGYNYGPRIVYRDNWVAPLIIGGIVGAAIARESAPVIVQAPSIVQQSPIYNNQGLVIIDNVVYVKQVVFINGTWQEVLIKQ